MVKRLLVVLALVLGIGTGANAATLSMSSSTTLNQGDTGEFLHQAANPGSFQDDWLFKVGTDATGLGAVINISLLGANITGLAAEIWDLTLNQMVGTSTSSGNSATFGANLLATEQYAVRVSGTATGSPGFSGLYAGAIGITGPLPAAVPIPPAFLLLGSALGGLVCVGRRKKAA